MVSREQGGVWRSLSVDNKPHVVCCAKENESWKVILTDLVEIWVENLTDESMLRRCQTLNPLLKLDAFDWKQLVMDMLNDIPKHAVKTSVSRMKLQKDMDFVKLKFSLELAKGTPEQFFEHVVMPLCLSSREVVHQHEILLDLVKKKDEEIAEYKAGGAELVRKYIATKPFSEELFQIDTTAPVATDLAGIFQSILNSCNTITLPRAQVKVEPEVSLNGASDDIPSIDGTELADSTRDEPAQETRQDEFTGEKESEKSKCKASSSVSGSSILKLSSSSHSIHKSLQKKRKTLSDFIS